MLTLEQKEEIYHFLCKHINYGVHPLNDVAQLLADNQMSSRTYGYGKLKTMLRDIPEYMVLLPPEEGSEEMRLRFSIWHRADKKPRVVTAKKRRSPAEKRSRESSRPARIQRPAQAPQPVEKYPVFLPEDFYSSSSHSTQMLHLLAVKTGRAEISLPALIESSYQQARATQAIDFTAGGLMFRLDLPAKNGNPIILSYKRSGAVWELIYIDDSASRDASVDVNHITTSNPAEALEQFAFLGRWEDFLQQLADMALPEVWDFPNSDRKNNYILKKYIQYTFYRVQMEGKVACSKNRGLAVFNTGLVDRHFDEIYACFVPNKGGASPWLFKEFCVAGHSNLGKQLVRHFNPLPQAASYVSRKEDLLFDVDQDIHCDYDHILIENIDRFPAAFLHNQFYDHPTAMKQMRLIERQPVADERTGPAFDVLRSLIENDMLLYNRLKNRLDDAVLLSMKEIRWNYRSAIPSYYPSRNTMNFMLPLHLTTTDAADCVLVCERTPAGNYQGQTILTCQQAYIDARLICATANLWLNSVLASK
jgi:hypothetical protein